MKIKLYLITASLACFVLSVNAQLKVDQYGRIGMGTNWPNPGYKCHVAGNLLCTSYPANPYYELQLKVGNGWPGCEIGASSDILAFWSSYVNYHELRASDFLKMSDSTFKSKVIPIVSPLERLLKIRPVFYSIEDNKIDGVTGNKITKEKYEFGFLSQEIRDVFSEVNITATDQNGFVLLDYDQIIPIAVASIQAQQEELDSLKSELIELKSQILNISLGLNNDIITPESDQNILRQNSPNPFTNKTVINFSVSEQNFRDGSIVIFDLNGLLIKKYEISKSGEAFIEIQGNELVAGMYIYTLIVNQREIDSKRMILLD